MRRAVWYKSPDFKFQQVALSLDDLKASDRLRRVQNVFNVCGMKDNQGAMKDALNACRAGGEDLNSIVFQTGVNEWWQLLPYVLGRGTDKSHKAMRFLLNEPDLRLDQQCAWIEPAAQKSGHALIMGLPHILVRIAADKLSDDPGKQPEQAAPYETLLDQMVERGLPLAMQDSAGDTVLHTVMRCMDVQWVDHWCTRLMGLGVDPDVRNHAGQTIIEVGQERLAKAPVNAPQKDRQRLSESLTRFEQQALTRLANQLLPDDPELTRPRTRL